MNGGIIVYQAKKPDDIPSSPAIIYSKNWIDFGDWLGTGRIANQDRKFRSLEEAKKFVHSLGLKNLREWQYYCKSGKLPKDIPVAPWRTYKKKKNYY